jgi:hypothetical protein
VTVLVLPSAVTTTVVMGGASPAPGEDLVAEEKNKRDQKYVFHISLLWFPESLYQLENLLYLLLLVRAGALAEGVVDAGFQVAAEDVVLDSAQGVDDRAKLYEYVGTIALLLYHSFDAADLPLDPVQSRHL